MLLAYDETGSNLSCGGQAEWLFVAVLSRHESVIFTLVVDIAEHVGFSLLGWTTFELPEQLVVALDAHHNLAVDVFDVHVLSVHACCVRPHQ